MIKLKDLIKETKRVKLSTWKDANFHNDGVQLVGKKGMLKLTKRDVHALAKIIRSQSRNWGSGMGWSFTAHEGKLTESSPYKTATRNELAMYISQLSTTIKNTKDRKMLNYLKKDKKEVEKELKSRKTNEGKLNEAKTIKLPSGHKVKIEFKGLTFKASRGGDVFLDRTELMAFFKATSKYLK